MPWIDTHCHLDEESLAVELPAVLERARAAEVHAIITIGTTLEGSRRAIELAETHPEIYAAVGIHPNYAQDAKPDDWAEIEQLAKSPHVVAVGETGLDRYWDYCPLETQRDYFDRHLKLSRDVGKPFIVHCREAEPEVLEHLDKASQEAPLHGVMHSFAGNSQTAARCLELGMFLSFSGMLTFRRNDELRQIAIEAPADRIFVETDAPYLAPAPNRGKRNEPAFVRHTGEFLAAARGISAEEMGAITTANARRFFRLPE